MLRFSSALLLAAVERLDPYDVPVGQAVNLADRDVGVGDGDHGFLPIHGEGCFPIVHDGGVVVGSIQVVGGLHGEVVGILRVDVLPVDLDVGVAVGPGMFVLETQSVVGLVLNDAVVEAVRPFEREHLCASHSAHRGETSGLVLDADVVGLILTGDKTNAGFGLEAVQRRVDQLLLRAGEVTAHGIGDHHQAVGSFLPPAALGRAYHGTSGCGSQNVSFQQDLVGGAVGGQNPGGHVDGVWDIFFASFLLDRICLREAEQEQQ